MDVVLFTIFHYFGRQWRWHDALLFFSTLIEVRQGPRVLPVRGPVCWAAAAVLLLWVLAGGVGR